MTNLITQAEFDVLVQASIQTSKPVDFAGKVLRGIKAKGYSLSKANFVLAELIDCDFSEADLRYANLNTAFAESCKFDLANFTYAHAQNATFRYCDFHRAILQYANLDHAVLQHTKWTRTWLNFANFTGAKFEYSDLSGADCGGADFGGCEFVSVTLKHTSFEQANLAYTRFPLAVMDNVGLMGAKLHEAHFRTSNLCYVGTDSRDYHFYIYKASTDAGVDAGKVYIKAGCRHMLLKDARKHWEQRHKDDLYLHEDCLSLVDRALKLARALTWLPTKKPATTKGKKK